MIYRQKNYKQKLSITFFTETDKTTIKFSPICATTWPISAFLSSNREARWNVDRQTWLTISLPMNYESHHIIIIIITYHITKGSTKRNDRRIVASQNKSMHACAQLSCLQRIRQPVRLVEIRLKWYLFATTLIKPILSTRINYYVTESLLK